MTDKSTDVTNENDFLELSKGMPKDLRNLLRSALDDMEKDPRGRAAVQYTKMSHDVFLAMLLCTLVSHNRASEHVEIHSQVNHKISTFSADQTYIAVQNPCQKSVDKVLFNVMLYTRALVEDALGVKRHDGTAKGEECKLHD